MRQFYLLIQKGAAVPHQLSWSHILELLPLKNIQKVNYYVYISEKQNLSYRELRERIKSNEYERIGYKELEKPKVNTFVKNPVIIKTNKKNNSNFEKLKKMSRWLFDSTGNLKPFKEQINDYINGKLPSGTMLIVAKDSQNISYTQVSNVPITMRQRDVKKYFTKHSNLSKDILENLDMELKDSVLGLSSLTMDNAIIIVLNKESNGNPIIVSISLDKPNASILVNEITSVYDKRKFQDFLNRTAKAGGNFYTNKNTKEWLFRNRLQLPIRPNNSLASNKNISQSDAKVKSDISANNMHNKVKS